MKYFVPYRAVITGHAFVEADSQEEAEQSVWEGDFEHDDQEEVTEIEVTGNAVEDL